MFVKQSQRTRRWRAPRLMTAWNWGRRQDWVESPNRTAVFDDGTVDHVTIRDPATGLATQKPIMAAAEEILRREIEALKRELAGVEYRLLIGPDSLPSSAPPSTGELERWRSGWQNTRAVIVERLEQLDAIEPQVNAKPQRAKALRAELER